jgi:quercetin dioxygenase-like cupin family protein
MFVFMILVELRTAMNTPFKISVMVARMWRMHVQGGLVDEKYSSKDFAKISSCLETQRPEKLLHKRVEQASCDLAFSRERKHPVSVVDLPSRAISMTIGGLEPGQSTNRHRHTYETILYVLEGHGYSLIEDTRVEWEAGDAVYVPVWAWHQHVNLSEKNRCRYVAAENAPQLQNLGVALREEA